MKKLHSTFNKIVFTSAITLLFVATGNAQNEEDALRYSRLDLSGSARFVSMGGAFTALGGDLSAISLNPATVGIFRKSEFNVSAALSMENSIGSFNGNNADANKSGVNLANIGYLVNFYTGRTNWKSASIAFGYNRTKTFNSEFTYDGISPGSSILDGYVDNLNKNGGTVGADVFDSDPFGAGPAYDAYLINPTATDSNQYFHLLDLEDNLYQEMTVTTKGGMGDYYFAFGGNFNDRIYLGASLNLATVRYDRTTTYKEIPNEPSVNNDYLVEMRRYENLFTTGTGFNFKVGMITRLTNWLRFGVTVHSPTYYRLRDYWSTQTDADYTNPDGEYRIESPDGEFEYRLNTAGKASTGIGIVVGKKGIISAEYEYVDYTLSRLSTPRNTTTGSYDFNLENEQIRRLYNSAGTIKAGTEWRFDPLRVRAGFNYQGNTYQNDIGEDNSRTAYTFGLGFRADEYYLDLGYSLMQYKLNHYAYSTIENPANIKTDVHSVILTLGVRF